MQAVEEVGGPYDYESFREFYAAYETMSQKKRNRLAADFGYENAAELYAAIDECLFDVELVNEQLSEIPDKWEDLY